MCRRHSFTAFSTFINRIFVYLLQYILYLCRGFTYSLKACSFFKLPILLDCYSLVFYFIVISQASTKNKITSERCPSKGQEWYGLSLPPLVTMPYKSSARSASWSNSTHRPLIYTTSEFLDFHSSAQYYSEPRITALFGTWRDCE